jgi:undecaprenyl-diphosphatase
VKRARSHESPRPRVDGDLVRDPRRALIASAAMLAAVILVTVVVASNVASPPVLQGIDDVWRRQVLAWPEWTRRIGQLLETVGAGAVMVPLRIAVAVWLAVRRRWWDLAAWLLAWAVADLLTFALKPAVARARPTPIDLDHRFTSFPSAHAKSAAQIAIGLVLLATSPWGSRRIAYGFAVAWIVVMGLSRTVVDHHWLSDVVAGGLLGAACALSAAASIQVIRDRR